MLFGRTQYNPMSQFLDEIPSSLVFDSSPVAEKKNSNFSVPRLNSTKDIIHEKTVFDLKQTKTVERFETGETVIHPVFGTGVVLSVTPMSSDTLYEIAFDNVGTKKLMGTYAKLKKL